MLHSTAGHQALVDLDVRQPGQRRRVRPAECARLHAQPGLLKNSLQQRQQRRPHEPQGA